MLRFRGSVVGIVPTVDRAKATVMTKIRFEKLDPRILPEMSAKVSFLSQAATDADQKPCWRSTPRRWSSATAASRCSREGRHGGGGARHAWAGASATTWRSPAR
jgi:hypothetical protein